MSSLKAALDQMTPKIGEEVGVSNWITVDQQMIDAFGHTTHDDQWIHMDPGRAAAEAPFGGTIAHGFLTLSLAARFSYDCFPYMPGQVMGINYGLDRLRFLAPVPAGAKLRGRFTLTDVKVRDATTLQRTTGMTIEIAGQDRPALVADMIALLIFAD